MRFLFLTQYYPPEVGAAQTRLHNIAKGLRKLGHEVRVITAMPNYPKGEVLPNYQGLRYFREVIDGIPVERTWIVPTRDIGMRRLLSYASFQWSSFWPLLRAARKWKPNYILVESPPLFLGLSAIALKRLVKVPFIFNIADLWPDWAVEMGLLRKGSLYYAIARWLENWIYRESMWINIVVLEMQKALEAKRVLEEKILFLPNGVDTELFSPEPRPLKSALAQELYDRYQGKHLVLYAGTHGKYHGLEVAIEAAKLLEPRGDIQFLFVGDGAEKQHLMEYSQERRAGNVEFREPVPPQVVAELLQISSIALSVIQIPTRAAKVFPAMAAGKPVVYAGIGEGADLIRKAQAGLVVHPKDSHALAEAVRTLVEDSHLAQTLGRNGAHYVRRYYDWSMLVSRWLSELQKKEKDIQSA